MSKLYAFTLALSCSGQQAEWAKTELEKMAKHIPELYAGCEFKFDGDAFASRGVFAVTSNKCPDPHLIALWLGVLRKHWQHTMLMTFAYRNQSNRVEGIYLICDNEVTFWQPAPGGINLGRLLTEPNLSKDRHLNLYAPYYISKDPNGAYFWATEIGGIPKDNSNIRMATELESKTITAILACDVAGIKRPYDLEQQLYRCFAENANIIHPLHSIESLDGPQE